MTKPAAIDRDFVDLVAKDIRGHSLTNDQRQLIHAADQVDRRYDALVALKKDVEVQLATQKARWCHKQVELQLKGDNGTEWLEYRSKEQDWRARAIKFLMAIEDEISAVKEIRRNTHMLPADEDVAYLRSVIARHRAETDDLDLVATDADRNLWGVLG